MHHLRLLLPPLLVMGSASAGRAESAPPPPAPEAIDLLIVVDTSAGMTEERTALAAVIGSMVEDISSSFPNEYGYGASLHVGVITADLGAGPHALPGCVAGGDGAALRAIPAAGCTGPTGAFVSREVDEWGNLTRNFDGELGDAVACIVPRELDGCVVQQPLAAARRALDGTVTDNVGFLRPDATLAILIVTNQEDCSTDDPATLFDPAAAGPATSYRCAAQGWTCSPPIDGTPQTHASCYVAAMSPLSATYDLHTAIRAVKSEPWKIAVGVLRGPAAPVVTAAGPEIAATCGAGTGRAASPALRVDELAGLFDHSALGSVCEDITEPFELAVQAAANDPGPGPDGDAGHGWCDGGGWGVDSGEGTSRSRATAATAAAPRAPEPP